MASISPQRIFSVARKEFLHILRDPALLFFTLFIPIVEMFSNDPRLADLGAWVPLPEESVL